MSSNDLARLLIGGALVAIGLLFLARPQIVDWINDNISLRNAREWAEKGDDSGLKIYPQYRKALRYLLPGFLFLVGLVVILPGIF